MQIATDEGRWAAVLAKDHAADDLFFYSVRTTGVYCRPSCAARPARRENVAFHLSTAEAKAAGFRPCKRCRPNEPPMAERHAAMVGEACRAIEAAEEVPSLATLSGLAGMSPYHFHRVFKSITGVTPKAYAESHRTRKVREALTSGGTVTEAIYDAGFNSGGRFYAKSAQVLGMTPTRFRAGGETATIRFAIGECSLGAILVAATEVGICSILLGDDPEALVRDLQDRFDRATLVGADPEFEALVAKVVGFVEQPGLGLDLPLDVRGTAFQQRVWQALRDIPAGETAGYLDIATKIGAPKAVRAVAQACAANHIAVAIPCHRVVRTDGALSGYRWGVERKRALLDREAAA
ncbi:MAG: bifunctional DNA-binding transcriptional regulator/O6-methylguanine-DNA methyltransferase Ada [Phenylobacterium sp.]|uniref:bifunctional DNA-binding transcriptional regulator/O6-methylguanine-DNA methyltransferase Ada n=1 Tax=Phenylobacterium sp. TaxID=1871053 RepID=UPI0027324473|nr:bifunctional DNA-binding transcriptional regulator/O6-methylguanine-DNA methyltransferase Ada [Phenylobacterium sp.]MDP3746121.1 bifunctional DNA-binding transcriptional regulator/O6-methylguanine-DNA methyltransferase Ada [Phenylobacterium sp.]